MLNYPRIDTYSLISGGANALSLVGYSDTQIQKMGRWKGKTDLEGVHFSRNSTTFAEGMSQSTIVNEEGNNVGFICEPFFWRGLFQGMVLATFP
jgi:hypothetical protein